MIFFIDGISIGMVGLPIKNVTPYPADILYIKCPKASFYFWAFIYPVLLFYLKLLSKDEQLFKGIR
ncbi:hypothetical protein J2780_001183 [Chryseobacterium camelliae]|nr:hypothetical protein [Chryseobacterium camelliae]